MTQILLKRGLAAGIPTLANGEPGWTTDTHSLYIGDGTTNHLIGPGASAGVSSLDTITGAVTLVAGSGVTITDNSPTAGSITIAATGGGSGTVTSVGLSLPSIFAVSGSPVTTSGTLTATLASETANTVFAAPNGSAGTPTFRALVGADLPVFGASGISHSKGAVPDPGSTAGTTRFLREDATWATPSGGSSIGGIDQVTSTPYSIPTTDNGKLVAWNAPSAMTGTLPSAASAGASWFIDVENRGTSAVSIAPPAGGSIDGSSSSLSLAQNQGVRIFCDGTSYYTQRGMASGGGGSGTVTSVGTSAPLTGGPITTSGTIGLAPSGVTPGTYTLSTITVDTYGRVTAASNGSGGGGSGTVTSVAFAAPSGWTVTGSPITTSGTITLTSPLTTKGDLLVHSTADARLPVGTDGTVLTADSTQTAGVKWTGLPGLTNGNLALGSTQTVTGTYAAVSGMSISLGSAGTYLFVGAIRGYVQSSSGSVLHCKLHNATAGTDIANSDVLITYDGSGGGGRATGCISAVITLTGSATIELWAQATGTFSAAQVLTDSNGGTVLNYAKLA